MKLDLLETARQFCRDHECSNVGLIHQAMLKGAEEAFKIATTMTGQKADELHDQHDKNLSGGHSR